MGGGEAIMIEDVRSGAPVVTALSGAVISSFGKAIFVTKGNQLAGHEGLTGHD
jgi:hypothetical protein